tara:strand:+ start:398 stop:610 length:213 start_codon:yes stop_codon:yes gene_type:complete
METKIEQYKLTPVSSTFSKPIRVIKVGTHNDPVTVNELKEITEFFEKFEKYIDIQYHDANEKTFERDYSS